MVTVRKLSLYSIGLLCLFVVGTLLYSYKSHLYKTDRVFIYKQSINTFKAKQRQFGNPDRTSPILCLTCFANVNTPRYKEYSYFTDKYFLDVPPMTSWVKQENTQKLCEGRITVYNDLFAILRNVKLDPSRRAEIGEKAKGGEEIKDVINQDLDKEDYEFNRDLLEMECFDRRDVGGQKLTLLKSLKLAPLKRNQSQQLSASFFDKYVVAVRRQDYANLHNWVRNIYNTFLMMMHFKIQPANVSVLFMDGHPLSELDKSWEVIYGTPLRIGQMSQPTLYQNFVIGLEEHEGPITDFRNEQVPYLEEFRSFVLSQFGLDPASKLNCSKLRITVIIRRNAVYHPRNIEGKVGRKIFNEAGLIYGLMKAFPSACVKPSLMEAHPMVSQLQIIRETDVLIGMHGAGMSHVTFLPKHAGVLELFAKGFKIDRPWFDCFHSITKWRNMDYDSWENFDSSLEMPADFTILPTEVIVNKTKGIINKLCSF